MEFIDLKAQYADLKIEIDARIQAVLDHGRYIMGPEVAELEQALAEYVGVRHCVTVASGTEALLIALMALDVKPGDEIVTTPFTFAATAEVILLLGAKPVFVDVELDTCNIDADQLSAAITERTRAILPVSLYGQTADMDSINKIAAEHGIPVIEDAAQSFGATYKGERSCSLSTLACTSFFPSKPLGCYGDGGALFTDQDDLAQAVREIRVHGQSERYVHTRLGVGGRMDTIQCAVVLAKLDRFPQEVERRIAAGQRYLDMIANNVRVGTPVVRDDRTCVWAQFTIQVDNRDEVSAYLQKRGVPTAIHYPMPLQEQPAYRDFSVLNAAGVNNANTVSQRVLSLPIHPYISESDQEMVVQLLAEAVN